MALVLNSAQFAAYHQHLVDRFRPAVLRGVHAGAQRAIGYLVARTRTAPPANPAGKGSGGAVDTGAFVRGWRVLRNADGATLVNATAHGPFVEHGRRPGSMMPPRDPLIAWIKRKLLAKPKAPRKKSKPRTKSDAERMRSDQERTQRAVRAIANGPRESKAKKPGRAKLGPSADEQAARLYFPIARAIARRGLKGRKILDADEPRAEILRMVEREVVAELNRAMKNL